MNHNFPGFNGWLGTFFFHSSSCRDSNYFICFLPFGDGLHLADNTQLATGLTPEESHNYSGNTSTCSSSRLLIVQRSISLLRK